MSWLVDIGVLAIVGLFGVLIPMAIYTAGTEDPPSPPRPRVPCGHCGKLVRPRNCIGLTEAEELLCDKKWIDDGRP